VAGERGGEGALVELRGVVIRAVVVVVGGRGGGGGG
jgi:hypothetical protein